MHFTRPLAVLASAALALVTLGAGPSGAAASPPYDDGLSTPQEDSYYPATGDPGIDALHYGLDLTWDRDARTLRGVADITIRATADADTLQLDLAQPMRVSDVTVDGEPATTTHREQHLVVQTAVLADQRYDVRVTYEGTPRPVPSPTTRSDQPTIGMRVTRDGQLLTMQEPFGALTWFPVNDQPSDKALYDVRVTAPRDWVGVSNGRLVSRHRTARATVTRFHLAHPAASYLTTLAVGPYLHRTAAGPHGLPLSYWVPRDRADRYLRVLRHLPDDLRWLESKLGPYPFESAGAVVVPGDSAMETQTLVTIGKQTWRNPAYAREVMVHELAHQWYGDTVTPADWSDLWLNEGMAMYVEARWASEHGPSTWALWMSFFRDRNQADREEQGGPGAYDPQMFATGCVYYCTASMYEALRKRIGDRRFWTLVRAWPQSRPDSNADRAAFIATAEEIGHDDHLDHFFDVWLSSPTWPPSQR